MSHHTAQVHIKAVGLAVTVTTVTGQALFEVKSDEFEYQGPSPARVSDLLEVLCFQGSSDEEVRKAVAEAQRILSAAGQGKQQCASPSP